MRFLFDENITPRVKREVLKQGHDAISIVDHCRGLSDIAVLQLAIAQKRILVTSNGKDFIVMVPPKYERVHNGLIWFTENISKKTVNQCVVTIDDIVSREYGSCITKKCHTKNRECAQFKCVVYKGSLSSYSKIYPY